MCKGNMPCIVVSFIACIAVVVGCNSAPLPTQEDATQFSASLDTADRAKLELYEHQSPPRFITDVELRNVMESFAPGNLQRPGRVTKGIIIGGIILYKDGSEIATIDYFGDGVWERSGKRFRMKRDTVGPILDLNQA